MSEVNCQITKVDTVPEAKLAVNLMIADGHTSCVGAGMYGLTCSLCLHNYYKDIVCNLDKT